MFDSFPRDPSESRARASQEEILICTSSGFGQPRVPPPTSRTDHRHSTAALKDSKVRYLKEIFSTPGDGPANQVLIADDSSDTISRNKNQRKLPTESKKKKKYHPLQEEENLPD